MSVLLSAPTLIVTIGSPVRLSSTSSRSTIVNARSRLTSLRRGFSSYSGSFSSPLGKGASFLRRSPLFFLVLLITSPYFGQAGWFTFYHHEKLPSAIDRYRKEIVRVIGVLDGVLGKQQYLVGDKLSAADLSFFVYVLSFQGYNGSCCGELLISNIGGTTLRPNLLSPSGMDSAGATSRMPRGV